MCLLCQEDVHNSSFRIILHNSMIEMKKMWMGLFLIGIWPCLGLAQPSLHSRFQIEWGWVAAKYDYQAFSLPPIQRNLFDFEAVPSFQPVSYRVGIYGAINANWFLGLGYQTYKLRQERIYVERNLTGTTIQNEEGTTQLPYHSTQDKLVVEQAWTNFNLRRRLFRIHDLSAFVLGGWQRATYSYVNLRRLRYQAGEEGQELLTRAAIEGAFNAVQGGLRLQYAFNPGVALFTEGTYSRVLSEKPAPYDRYQYVQLQAGVSLGVAGPKEKASQALRKNTILIGGGWPTSLSYERLVYAGRQLHAVRVFRESYIVQGGFWGMAYNVKFGSAPHYFLLEAVMYPDDKEAVTGGLIGYELRTPFGLVVRGDMGYVQGPRFRELRATTYLGYAF